jgi:DNA polymerase I
MTYDESKKKRKQKEVKGRKPKAGTAMLGEEHLGVLEGGEIGLDIETSGLSPWRDKVAVVTLTDRAGHVVVAHPRGRLSKRLKEFIASRDILVGHNLAGFDFLCLLNAGVDVLRPRVYDTMCAELALQSTDRRDVSVSLKSTVARRTGVALAKDADHSGWMNQTLTPEQVKYCREDVLMLFKLQEEQAKRAEADKDGQLANAIQVENDLVAPIVMMVNNGVPVDVPKMRAYLAQKEKDAEAATARLREALGPINLGSAPQLKKALKERMGADFKSTDKTTLTDQVNFGGALGQVCSDILEWRRVGKRKSMYSDAWIDRYVVDGRIHPRIWTCSTDTGRMSSSDPNAQQWPRDMRVVCGGVPGHKMVWADYSQLEVRVAAAVANCPGLKAIFADGRHVHTLLASEAFGTVYDSVTEAQKQLAKGLTFTILFGGGPDSFYEYARRAGYDLSPMEARQIFKRFFERCPGMFRLKQVAQAKAQQGRTRPVTLRLPTGLKRVLIGWKASPSRIMNTLIQGSAAAGMKFAVLEAHRRGLMKYACAPIHDELLGCVPDKEVRDYMVELSESMEEGMREIMDVPAPVEAKSGAYWGK